MKIKDNVLRMLTALLLVFFVGYASSISLHLFFSKIIANLDRDIKNEQARYKIGEYLLEKINSIEKNYYKMAITFNIKALSPLEADIKKEISDVMNAMDILENGGVLNRNIDLNLVGISKVVEKISFTPDTNVKYTFEAISLKPKIKFIEGEIKRMSRIVSLKDNMLKLKDKEKRAKTRFEIQLFFKEIPSLFVRLKENTSRLLYEGKMNLSKLEENIKREKKFYSKLEFLLTSLIMLLVLILSYIIIKLILKRSRDLKALTLRAEESAKEASRANQIKSQFLANMSHEIRTPLNAIIGFSEILSHSNISPKEKEQSMIINKSANSLLNIINDILDISKVESGKFELSTQKVNFKDVLDQIVELYSINTKQKNIRFIYKLIGDIPKYIYTDETRLKQVLSNIVSNAIKFTPEFKSVLFEVKLIKVDDKKVTLKFLVKDEGIGVSKENQKKIFEPFSQADVGISRKFGGTGLGLAISLKIIENMGSKIKLISQKDKGSTFFFELDFAYEYEETKDKKYKFLVCDLANDEESLKNCLENTLKDYGIVYENEEVDKVDLIFCFGNSKLMERLNYLSEKYNVPIVFVGNKEKLDEEKISDIDFYIDTPIYGSKVFNIIAQTCYIEKNALNLSKDMKNYKFKGKVLVAEDNPNNQLLIKLLLEDFCLDIDIVENGEKAYNLYKKNKYDIVFLDINMPIIDGLKALELIRVYEKEQNIHTPMVALTANTIIGDKEKYLSAGMDEYLSKPIKNDELFRVLSKYLKKSYDITKNKETDIKENSCEIDLDLVSKSLGLSPNIAQRIVDKFKNDIISELDIFENIINTGNKEEISEKAHFIKNSCLNVCLDDICKILQEIEKDDLSIEEIKEKFYEIREKISSLF